MFLWPIKFCQLNTPGQNWLYEIFQMLRFDDSPFGLLFFACVLCVCLLHLCFNVNCLLCLLLLLFSFHNNHPNMKVWTFINLFTFSSTSIYNWFLNQYLKFIYELIDWYILEGTLQVEKLSCLLWFLSFFLLRCLLWFHFPSF